MISFYNDKPGIRPWGLSCSLDNLGCRGAAIGIGGHNDVDAIERSLALLSGYIDVAHGGDFPVGIHLFEASSVVKSYQLANYT